MKMRGKELPRIFSVSAGGFGYSLWDLMKRHLDIRGSSSSHRHSALPSLES